MMPMTCSPSGIESAARRVVAGPVSARPIREKSTGRPNATRGVVVTAIDTLRVGVVLRINSPVFAIQYGCPEKYGGSDSATRYFVPPPGNGCKKVPPPLRALGSRD